MILALAEAVRNIKNVVEHNFLEIMQQVVSAGCGHPALQCIV